MVLGRPKYDWRTLQITPICDGGVMASSYDSDTKNILVGLASAEVRIQLLSEKLDERLEALEERMDERHEALLERLEAREAARDEAMRGFVRDVVKESLSRVHSRLDDVEKKQQQMTYAAGGVAAVAGAAAWVWEHLASKLLPAVVILLAGCAPVAASRFSWPMALRPVSVLVDGTLPPECKLAVTQALGFWRAKGITFLDEAPGAPGDGPLLGEIVVTSGVFDFPVIGQTDRETFGEDMLRAVVKLQKCDAQLASHEIGHALGLDHADDPDSVMYPEAGNRWDVSRGELESIQ